MDLILIETKGLKFGEFSGFMPALTKDRRASTERLKNDGDKLNALLSGLLVMSEITVRTGIPRRRIAFERGSYGKPYLKGGELWFSVSHTGGAVCAAFSKDGEIGADIERRGRRVNDSLRRRILGEDEAAAITTDEELLRAWVKKEAFLKRLGVGITRDLRGVNSLILPDTEVMSCGGFFVGVSGAGAAECAVKTMSAEELSARFVKQAAF